LEPINPYILISAVILDILIGDPRWFPHPVVFVGKLISILERVLRSSDRNEMLGGALLLVMTVAISCGGTAALLKLAYAVNSYLGFTVAVIISWSCLAARSLHRESQMVADALVQGDLVVARRYLANIVGRDTAELDEPEVWRAAVETVAENTSDGVIAPLFYLCIGGPLLAIAYKAVNTLDSMVGYRNERYIEFGRASARFDDLANFIPARITGLLMVAAAPLFGLPARNAWRIMRRDGRNHSSPNSGIPEAAVAGALGIRLGGTNLYGGRPVEKPTIGDAVKQISQASWRGAVRLMYGAEALLLAGWLIIKYIFELTGVTG
jgi:adenosylcobinamide-phosphate synthase